MAKPASGTALDTGHALYTDLLYAWGLLEGSGNPASSATANAATKNGGAWTTDADGPLLSFTDHTIAHPLALATSYAPASSRSFSLAFRVALTANNDYGMVCGNGTDYIWLRGGNYLRIVTSLGNSNWTSLTSFTSAADYLITFEFIPGVSNLWRVYKDGVITSEGAVSFGGALTIADLAGGFSNLCLEGLLSYFYIWDGRVLTGTDAVTLDTNPYAIFTGGGGGGGSAFPMVYYQQQRRRHT